MKSDENSSPYYTENIELSLFKNVPFVYKLKYRMYIFTIRIFLWTTMSTEFPVYIVFNQLPIISKVTRAEYGFSLNINYQKYNIVMA